MKVPPDLLEAHPGLRSLAGATVVIKYGGSAMVNDALKREFARDIVLLKKAAVRPVVVHGGGPCIGRLLDRLGKPTEFVDGMRVTDAETMAVVEMVLGGQVNQEIVGHIVREGGRALGLTGRDAGLLRARKMLITRYDRASRQTETIDIGRVGEIERIDPAILDLLLEGGVIPVIAPIGMDADGLTYNINADLAAGKIAQRLNALRLVLLTNTPGLLGSDGKPYARLDPPMVEALVAAGAMLPKTRCAVEAVQGGVGAAQIVDGRAPHAVLLALCATAPAGSVIEKSALGARQQPDQA